MKILIVRYGVLGGGGVSRVVESWSRVLLSMDHEVWVLSEEPAAGSTPVTIPGIRHLRYAAPRSGNRFGKFRAARANALRAIGALHRETDLDLVISHYSHFSTGIFRAFPDLPVLGTYHSPLVDENHLNNWKYAPALYRKITYPLTFLRSWSVDRQALRSIRCAHTLSDYTWRLLSSRYPRICAKLERVKIQGSFDESRFVPPPDRTRIRRELGMRDDELVLLTVRRLIPRNAVERILHAARRLERVERPVSFLIGGTGDRKSALEAMLRDRNLSRQVRMLGFVPESALHKYYQASDAFLLPTRDLECFGLPVIEAMACGCPPLVMPDGGPAEICRSYPKQMAKQNTSAAFCDLVESFVRGEIRTDPAALVRDARADYSEAAIRPLVRNAVELPVLCKRS